MLSGIGLDLVAISRIRRLRERYGKRFLERVFAEEELAYAFKKAFPDPSLAASWAAKEALGKALGRGLSGLPLKEIVLARDLPTGAPRFLPLGQAQDLHRGPLWVSVSHEGDWVAVVVLLGKEDQGCG